MPVETESALNLHANVGRSRVTIRRRPRTASHDSTLNFFQTMRIRKTTANARIAALDMVIRIPVTTVKKHKERNHLVERPFSSKYR
jgi:hypothetical protein